MTQSPTRTAPFTGEEYLASLRDGREVWIDGERVADVTEHPAFRNAARSVARLYDAMHAPETRDLLTAEDRFGIRTHRFFVPSYSAEDLLASREAIAHWSRMSYGHMGRTPDYKASFMATLGADPGWYAPLEESGRRWYREYAEKALFLNHVLINPPIDRDKAVHEVEDVYVHVVGERDDGIVVSGAKMLATGSAITHATFVAQNSAVHLEEGKAEDYALVFIAPMDTPGKKLICRRSYEADARSPWENPLAARFDENDAVVIFDDAFIPWENVLVYRDVKEGDGLLRPVGVHAALHAAVGHAPGDQARLPVRAARARAARQRDGLVPRRAGEARRARRLAQPDLGADGGALPRADAGAGGERGAEARVRDADPAVRHAGGAARARDLRRDSRRRAARDAIERRRPAQR